MAATTEGNIFEALAARLAAYSTSLTIAWPDKVFTKPATLKWLRVNQFRAAVNRYATAGTTDEHVGFLQIDVMWPLNRGEVEAVDVAGAIRAHFNSVRKIYGTGVVVGITSCRVASAIRDGDQTQIPITINWRSFAA